MSHQLGWNRYLTNQTCVFFTDNHGDIRMNALESVKTWGVSNRGVEGNTVGCLLIHHDHNYFIYFHHHCARCVIFAFATPSYPGYVALISQVILLDPWWFPISLLLHPTRKGQVFGLGWIGKTTKQLGICLDRRGTSFPTRTSGSRRSPRDWWNGDT